MQWNFRWGGGVGDDSGTIFFLRGDMCHGPSLKVSLCDGSNDGPQSVCFLESFGWLTLSYLRYPSVAGVWMQVLIRKK